MLRKNIDFSIIIPTYNRSDSIGKAVKSLLNQSSITFEIIIIDDGSTDETEKIIFSFKDERIRYYKKQNEERSIARNYGISKAAGKYISFLDADDYVLSNHLIEAFCFAEKNGFPEVFHLGYRHEDENGKILRVVNDLDNDAQSQLIRENRLICNAIFIRHDIANLHTFINSSDAIFAEDWYLWLVLASHYNFKFSNIITSVVVEHSNRSLARLNPIKVKKSIDIIINTLRKDNDILKHYGKDFYIFVSKRYFFCSNLFLENNMYRLFFICLFYSIKNNPTGIIRRIFNKISFNIRQIIY